LADNIWYLYHTAQLRLYCSCTAWFSRGHLQTVALIIYITRLFGWCTWYGAYHICLGLIFQYEFNHDVCLVIGLPYLAIISGMLDQSISYMSGTHFSLWIQPWCLFCNQITLFGNNFENDWYGEYHISPRVIFQYESNCDVCFVIGLPYLVIILGMLDMKNIIYVQDLFFIWIQLWCFFCDRTTLFGNCDQCHCWSD